jgi:anti-sigma B factor antagonist
MQIATQDVGEVVVIYVSGEIRRSHVKETTLHQAVKSQLERGKRKILFNLEKVDFIDSWGVGEILASYTSIQNLGGKIKLARISRKLDIVLTATWLKRVLEVFEDETAALQSFAKP